MNWSMKQYLKGIQAANDYIKVFHFSFSVFQSIFILGWTVKRFHFKVSMDCRPEGIELLPIIVAMNCKYKRESKNRSFCCCLMKSPHPRDIFSRKFYGKLSMGRRLICNWNFMADVCKHRKCLRSCYLPRFSLFLCKIYWFHRLLTTESFLLSFYLNDKRSLNDLMHLTKVYDTNSRFSFLAKYFV